MTTSNPRHDFDTRATQNHEGERHTLQGEITAVTCDNALIRKALTNDEDAQGAAS